MTVILTAPARLAMMLMDVHVDVRNAYEYDQPNIDELKRPLWIIDVGELDNPPRSESSETPEETFLLNYVGQNIRDGLRTTAADGKPGEKQAREIFAATFEYFGKRRQLQFTNGRGLEAAQLGPLNGVQWARLTRRTQIAPSTRGGSPESPGQPFWGFSLTITISSMIGYVQEYGPRNP